MSISKEAAYLYIYSKELRKLHKELQKRTKKAQNFAQKFQKASSPETKIKFKVKHEDTIQRIKSLHKEHNKIISKIKHHYSAFAKSLQKEHKL